jgi:hypothetical protein
MMARTAALSGAGSLAQALTIRVRSGQDGIGFRESIRESSSDFPIKTGGERGIRTPQFPADNKGNPHDDTQRDSQISVPSSPELSQVVTAWEKLPVPLKAAILAIVNSAEGQP